MPRLHLYVPEEIAAEVALQAGSRGLSVSRYRRSKANPVIDC